MTEERVPYESTGVNSTYLPFRGMGVFVIAAGWPATFTMCMAGAGVPVSGGNTTISWNVFADLVTPLDTSDDS